MKKNKILIWIIVVIILVVGFLIYKNSTAKSEAVEGQSKSTEQSTNPDQPSTSFSQSKVEGQSPNFDEVNKISSIEEGIKYANSLFSNNPSKIVALVTPQALIFKDEQGQEIKQIPVPQGKFYAFIAPYVNTTHECGTHFSNSCKGESGKERFKVKISDKATGEVLSKRIITSEENGFFNLLLDANKDYTVGVINSKGLKGMVDISTSGTSPTCITNLKLYDLN